MLNTKSRVKKRLRVTSINLNSALIYFLALFIATNALAEPPASNQANTTNKQLTPNCIAITISSVDPENNTVDQIPVSVPIDTSPATHRVETLHTQPRLGSTTATNNSQTNNAASSVPAAGTCP